VKRPDFLESLRLRLPIAPRLNPVGIGAPLQFASSGGGGGRYDDDPDDEYYDDIPEEPAPSRRREEGQRPTAGRQRTVQSDPDDRYWTDYLRIALPVIGLLLVIAVFWFWAQQLIDDPEEELTPTEPGLAEVIETEPAAEPPAATPTVAAAGQVAQNLAPTPAPQQQQAQPTPTAVTAADTTEEQPPADAGTDNQVDEPVEEEPADAASETGIAPDTEVTVTEGPLNMRAESNTDSEIVTELETGAILTVVSGPEEGENYVWWQVTDEAGNIGWVAEDFIEPAG
jgi:uncharacterized protein YgiM (DUF1202 family)